MIGCEDSIDNLKIKGDKLWVEALRSSGRMLIVDNGYIQVCVTNNVNISHAL